MRSNSKVWKIIRPDVNLKTVDDFLNALKARRVIIGSWAWDIMSHPIFFQSIVEANLDQEYELFILNTSQLIGKQGGGTTAEVFASAEQLYLEKCPAWVGPMLRIDYNDQPAGRRLIIGMEPVNSPHGRLVFCLDREGFDLLLRGGNGEPKHLWRRGDSQWVFCRPYKSR